jgi:hypothetical protein
VVASHASLYFYSTKKSESPTMPMKLEHRDVQSMAKHDPSIGLLLICYHISNLTVQGGSSGPRKTTMYVKLS